MGTIPPVMLGVMVFGGMPILSSSKTLNENETLLARADSEAPQIVSVEVLASLRSARLSWVASEPSSAVVSYNDVVLSTDRMWMTHSRGPH